LRLPPARRNLPDSPTVDVIPRSFRLISMEGFACLSVPFRHAILALTHVFDHGQVVDRKLCHAIRRIFDAQTTDSFAAAFKEGIGEVKTCLAGRHFVEFPQG
jgi:hypothetical protein